MMAVTRSPARLSPALLPPSSATTLSVSRNSGPAMVTPTAPMAQMSGPATVVRRDLTLPLLISAHPWSSTVAVESVSTVAGSVMEDLTALTNQMKLIVVRTIANFFFFFTVGFLLLLVLISCTHSNFDLLPPTSTSHLPS